MAITIEKTTMRHEMIWMIHNDRTRIVNPSFDERDTSNPDTRRMDTLMLTDLTGKHPGSVQVFLLLHHQRPSLPPTLRVFHRCCCCCCCCCCNLMEKHLVNGWKGIRCGLEGRQEGLQMESG